MMDRTTLDKWVPFRNEGAVVRCRLFCFPHAAGSAAFYRPLRRFMPPEINLCPVEFPGRAARLDEPAVHLHERSYGAAAPGNSATDGSATRFFGHNVGAIAAYEAGWKIRSVDGRTAEHLFVSGSGSPNCNFPPPARLRSLVILGRFGGTPTEIMQRPELIAAIAPALKADIALAEGYAVDAGDCINCPITVFGGADDVSHTGSLQRWRDFAGEK